MKEKFIFFFIITTVLLFSCAGSKEIPRAKKADLTDLIDSLNQHQMVYEWFSAKAKVKFEGDEMRMGGRANLRMIKDSLIWMNFKKMSIEGSRILITRDSFWIVYRIDKMYESGSFEELMEAYDIPFSFSELQNLVVGNFPIPLAAEVGRYSTKKLYELSFISESTNYQYTIDGKFQLRDFIIKDIFGRSIVGNYGDYDNSHFAYKKSFIVTAEDIKHANISIDFTDVEFDVIKRINFDVPKHYRKLP